MSKPTGVDAICLTWIISLRFGLDFMGLRTHVNARLRLTPCLRFIPARLIRDPSHAGLIPLCRVDFAQKGQGEFLNPESMPPSTSIDLSTCTKGKVGAGANPHPSHT